jgi:hypothetical protein
VPIYVGNETTPVLFNPASSSEEAKLFHSLYRSQVEPQGMCIVNAGGQALVWAMNREDNEDILSFLDHGLERFGKNPDGQKPVATERYIHYPRQRLEDYKTEAAKLPIAQGHSGTKGCPSWTQHPKGTVFARLVGRALSKDGKPVADTARQGNYVEDRFHITVRTQEKLAKALAEAGTDRVKLPLEVTREWVKHAYMGVLDVQPLDKPGGLSKGELKKCAIGVQKVGTGKGLTLWRVEGESEVFIDDTMPHGRPGDMHEVKLKWHGFIEMDENRMTRLVLSAGGSEKLKFARLFDMACEVRFGILGEPVAVDEAGKEGSAQEIPNEARKQLATALGGPFLVFRDKVMEELKLSEDQRQKLLEKLPDHIEQTMKVFEKIKDLKPAERDKEMQSHRQKSHEKLAKVLKETLKDEQLKRLRQLELQQAGAFVLGRPDIGKELKITDEQRKQFMAVAQELQKKIAPLIKEAQSGGNPEEIRPKIMKARKEHEGKIEAILTEAQKKQWKKMLGKPLDLDD